MVSPSAIHDRSLPRHLLRAWTHKKGHSPIESLNSNRGGVSGPTCIAVKVGAQTLVFPNEGALHKHEQALVREERLDPTRPAGRHGVSTRFVSVPGSGPRYHTSADATLVPQVNSVWTTGNKTVLYIRVDFSDLPGEPVAGPVVQSTVDGAVSTFCNETSYGKTTLQATVTPCCACRTPHSNTRPSVMASFRPTPARRPVAGGFHPRQPT